MAPHQIADVLMPLALDTAYSYAVPPGLSLSDGDVVQVPLGTRETIGVAWSLREGAGSNLKPVTGLVDAPRLEPKLRRLIDWIAWYTLAPKGAALALALRLPEAGRAETPRVGVRATGQAPRRLTPARARVMQAAQGGLVHLKRELAQAASVGVGVIDSLVDDGVLATVALAPEPVALRPDPDHGRASLSPDQRRAATVLAAAVATIALTQAGGAAAGAAAAAAGKAPVILLDGVTGSGKTEVYFEAVAAALRRARRPDAHAGDRADGAVPRPLRGALRRRVRRNGTPASARARRERVCAGSRSGRGRGRGRRPLGAVPALRRARPRSSSTRSTTAAYKQEDGVLYHARDMAVVRGRLERLRRSSSPRRRPRSRPGSMRAAAATPARRAAGALRRAALPEIRRDRHAARRRPRAGAGFADRCAAAIAETLGGGEQALLFLNRRGYAPLTLCRACGHRFECPNCAAWLVEHRFRGALVCHHCGHDERRPEACPACGKLEPLVACGPGVERLAEEVAALFPDARTHRPVQRSRRRRRALRPELEAIAERRGRHRHRDAARRQGPQLPAADPGRRGRRRPRPGQSAIRAPPSGPFSCCSR